MPQEEGRQRRRTRYEDRSDDRRGTHSPEDVKRSSRRTHGKAVDADRSYDEHRTSTRRGENKRGGLDHRHDHRTSSQGVLDEGEDSRGSRGVNAHSRREESSSPQRSDRAREPAIKFSIRKEGRDSHENQDANRRHEESLSPQRGDRAREPTVKISIRKEGRDSHDRQDADSRHGSPLRYDRFREENRGEGSRSQPAVDTARDNSLVKEADCQDVLTGECSKDRPRKEGGNSCDNQDSDSRNDSRTSHDFLKEKYGIQGNVKWHDPEPERYLSRSRSRDKRVSLKKQSNFSDSGSSSLRIALKKTEGKEKSSLNSSTAELHDMFPSTKSSERKKELKCPKCGFRNKPLAIICVKCHSSMSDDSEDESDRGARKVASSRQEPTERTITRAAVAEPAPRKTLKGFDEAPPQNPPLVASGFMSKSKFNPLMVQDASNPYQVQESIARLTGPVNFRKFELDKFQIRELIGKGGDNIKRIRQACPGTDISIQSQEQNRSGTIRITGNVELAEQLIRTTIASVSIGPPPGKMYW